MSLSMILGKESAKGSLNIFVGIVLQKPKGLGITAPGLGLLALFKEELKTNLNTLDLNELCDSLQKTILENFQLAKEIQIQPQNNTIHITITNSTYKDLYCREKSQVSTLLDPNCKRCSMCNSQSHWQNGINCKG